MLSRASVPNPGSQATSCVDKQPVVPSFCPLLTKTVLQLGMGAVPGTSMLNAAQMGKSCCPVESQLARPGPCIPASFVLIQGFLSPQEPRQEAQCESGLLPIGSTDLLEETGY